MAWNLINTVTFAAGSTSGAISGTGADLAIIAYGGGSFATPGDSSSNTYTLNGSNTAATNSREGVATYICHNPTVTGSMTFNAGTTPSFTSCAVLLFSGSGTGTITDGEADGSIAYTTAGTQIVIPSATTTGNGDLIFAVVSIDDPAGSSFTFGGMTLGPVLDVAVGSRFGVSTGWTTQGSSGAFTSTWTRSTAGSHTGEGAMMTGYKAAPPAASVPYNLYQNQPQLSSVLAQHHRPSGWTPNQDHRWRRQRSGLMVPERRLIVPDRKAA